MSVAGLTLCVVGAGVEAADGIAVAHGLGLHVVATDADPDAPGFAVAKETSESGILLI